MVDFKYWRDRAYGFHGFCTHLTIKQQGLKKMRKIVFGLLLLTVVMGTALGTNYTIVEGAAEKALHKQAIGIYKPDINISTEQVTIDYITVMIDEDEIFHDLKVVMATYAFIVNNFPEVGDLKANVRLDTGELVASYRCEKEWVKDLGPDESRIQEILANIGKTIEYNGSAEGHESPIL